MQPRVLHIIPALNQGGAEKLLFDLVCHDRQGIDMKVITLLAEAPFFLLDDAVVSSASMERGRLSVAAIVRLRRMIREFRPDVVHAWLYHGNLFSMAGLGLRIPTVWSIHNTSLSAQHSKPLTRWANIVCARASRIVPDCIVYCTPAARDMHEKFGYDRSRGMVIENGIDVAAFAFKLAARKAIREAIGLPEADFAVGCIARFDPQKNHPLLIEAFSRLTMGERAKLVLAGQGCSDDNAELVGLLRRFGVYDRTRLLGPRRDMPAVMSALDVVVIASSYGEALPLAAIEAAAAGLPVVTTNVGDAHGLALDPSHVVAPGDAAAIAAAIHHAQRNAAELQARKADRLSRIMQDFSLDKTIARYHALYRRLAADMPARS